MDKRRDFGQDLAALTNYVEAGVGDVLQVLREKRGVPSLAVVETSPPANVEAKPIAETKSTSESETGVQSLKPIKARVARQGSRARTGSDHSEHKVLINVTTRLRPETNELLTQASLHQRLKNIVPDTRQDIVEEALQDWFRKHSYGD